MSAKLDMDRIAKALGAERRGQVTSRGGYFGALQLAADLAAQSSPPASGEECLVRLSTTTRQQLAILAERAHSSPTQVATVLLEQAVQSAASQI